MLHCESFDEAVAMGVTAESIYTPIHRRIYEAMYALYDANRSWDIMMLPSHINLDEEREVIEFATLADISDKATATGMLGELASVILDHYQRRKIISAAREIESGAYECKDAFEYQAKAEARLDAANELPSDEPIEGVVDEVISDMKRGMAGEQVVRGISTGYEVIDRAFGGCLRNGGVYFVSGPAKSGKSTLSMNILLNMVRTPIVASAASLELTKAQLVEIMINNIAGCNSSRVIDGREGVTDTALERAREVITSGYLRIAPRIFDIASIKAWGRREVRKHGAKILWLDYVQRIRADEGKQNDAMRVVSGEITALAAELDVPLLVVSAVNADGKLRWAGELTYDTYGTLRLEADEDAATSDFTRIVNVTVEDNRFGPAGVTWQMAHQTQLARFIESGD
jgi:replicative DNA helicase